MKHDYSFRYGRITLLPLTEDDIEQLRLLRNKERQYFASTSIITPEQQLQWYKNYLSKPGDYMFKIVKTDSLNEFIGAIAVYDISSDLETAEVGRTVVDKDKAPEKGIGLEATKAICRFSFDVLGIKKIVAEILKTNERIIKVDTRAGFYITGEKGNDMYSIEMTPESWNP